MVGKQNSAGAGVKLAVNPKLPYIIRFKRPLLWIELGWWGEAGSSRGRRRACCQSRTSFWTTWSWALTPSVPPSPTSCRTPSPSSTLRVSSFFGYDGLSGNPCWGEMVGEELRHVAAGERRQGERSSLVSPADSLRRAPLSFKTSTCKRENGCKIVQERKRNA